MSTAEIIARLSSEIVSSRAAWLGEQIECGQPDRIAHTATVSGGIPVHSNWTGFFVVMPDGTVTEVDSDDYRAVAVTDGRFLRYCYQRVGELFPCLQSLAPQRPAEAVTCGECDGVGKREGNVCTGCFLTGWVDSKMREWATQPFRRADNSST